MAKNGLAPAVIALCVIGAIGVLAIRGERAPDPLGMDAPVEMFSAGRALVELSAISGNGIPHPNGSAEKERLRDHLVGRFRALGFTPTLQELNVWNKRQKANALVQNIVAILEGKHRDHIVVVSAHYDSVASSPGAVDDGSGVAAVLEIARALKHIGQPSNSILFLLADAEEQGLLGSRAFVERHPLARNVKVAFNIDAGADRGPSAIVQAGGDNGWLINVASKALTKCSGSSANLEFRRLFSANQADSDFYPFKQAGAGGFFFANYMVKRNHHTPSDTVQNVTPSTLQHHGQNVLAMVLALSDTNLEKTPRGDHVFFGLFGVSVLHYPYSLVLPLAAVVLMLSAAALYRLGILVKNRSGAQLAWGGLAWLLSVVVGSVAGGVAALILGWLVGGRALIAHPEAAVIPVTVVSVGGFLVVQRAFVQRAGAEGLFGGALLSWTVLSLTLAVFLPGLSYLAAWPALGLALGAFCLAAGRLDTSSWRFWTGMLPGMAISMLLFSSLAMQTVQGLSPANPSLPIFLILAAGTGAPAMVLERRDRACLLLGIVTIAVTLFAVLQPM
jgi:hypothetical protein